MHFLPVPRGALCVRIALAACGVGLVVAAGGAAHACVVGDLAEPVRLVLTETPPDCCYGSWAGTLHGTVTNVVTDDVVVAVYAQTDLYYVQPTVGATIDVGCTGTFSTPTRGGSRYIAVLARRGWQPPAQTSELPAVGGDVLAVVSAPDAQRQIDFAGYSWVVKSTGSVPYGPGPNLWSDAPDAVWVDAQGRLHLRVTQRDGLWYSAEVFTRDYVGHGRYRFDVDTALDALDPNVVFAGFVYSAQGDEADIEFSRWGDPGRASNAQFVVQPDAIHPWTTAPGTHHALQFDWAPDRMEFYAAAGASGAPSTAQWTYTGEVPTPDVERMRFNLWLYGAPPTDGNEVEVIVSAYSYGTPTHAPTLATSGVTLETLPVSRGRVEYVIGLARAGTISMQVFDARGRLIERLAPRHLQAGATRGAWQPRRADTASGVYFLRVQRDAASAATRVVLLR